MGTRSRSAIGDAANISLVILLLRLFFLFMLVETVAIASVRAGKTLVGILGRAS